MIRALPMAGERPGEDRMAARRSPRSVYYTAQATGKLGILDPGTGKVEEIPLGPDSAPHGVIVGPYRNSAHRQAAHATWLRFHNDEKPHASLHRQTPLDRLAQFAEQRSQK